MKRCLVIFLLFVLVSACSPQTELGDLPTVAILPTTEKSPTIKSLPTIKPTQRPAPTELPFQPTQRPTATPAPLFSERPTLPVLPTFTALPELSPVQMTATKLIENIPFPTDSRDYDLSLQSSYATLVSGIVHSRMDIGNLDSRLNQVHVDGKLIWITYTYESSENRVLEGAKWLVSHLVCDLRNAGMNNWTILIEVLLEESIYDSLPEGDPEISYCVTRQTLAQLNCDVPERNAVWSTMTPRNMCEFTN